MGFEPLVPTQSRSQQIVSQIEQQIRSGELAVGEKLATEKELCEQFGVSRSVVREAIKLLEAMGLVVSRQGSGSYVRKETGPAVSRLLSLSVSPGRDAVAELFKFREVLEMSAAKWAADHATDADLDEIAEILEQNRAAVRAGDGEAFTSTDWKLHSRIAEASRNRYLAVVLTAVREMQHDVVRMLGDDVGSAERAAGEHAEIVASIRAHDPERARVAAREHIRTTAASALERQ
ncbi:FadR/GntR family transcriptional regulator [Agromyces sp. SYSU T00194]|uniref:FadR/GntR family transcriptional regulator n=1 Tax=Agromyces chitinivorans TaxID=3158560 RepID=UPI003396B121